MKLDRKDVRMVKQNHVMRDAEYALADKRFLGEVRYVLRKLGVRTYGELALAGMDVLETAASDSYCEGVAQYLCSLMRKNGLDFDKTIEHVDKQDNKG